MVLSHPLTSCLFTHKKRMKNLSKAAFQDSHRVRPSVLGAWVLITGRKDARDCKSESKAFDSGQDTLISVHLPKKKNPVSSQKELICFCFRRELSTHYIAQTLIWDTRDQPVAKVIFTVKCTYYTQSTHQLPFSSVFHTLDINHTL